MVSFLKLYQVTQRKLKEDTGTQRMAKNWGLNIERPYSLPVPKLFLNIDAF